RYRNQRMSRLGVTSKTTSPRQKTKPLPPAEASQWKPDDKQRADHPPPAPPPHPLGRRIPGHHSPSTAGGAPLPRPPAGVVFSDSISKNGPRCSSPANGDRFRERFNCLARLSGSTSISFG